MRIKTKQDPRKYDRSLIKTVQLIARHGDFGDPLVVAVSYQLLALLQAGGYSIEIDPDHYAAPWIRMTAFKAAIQANAHLLPKCKNSNKDKN